MGLVVKTTHIHTPSHRVLTEGSSSSNFEDVGSFDMSILRMLNAQSDMKTLTYPSVIRNEFDRFIQYAEDKTNGAINSSFDDLDDFLGTPYLCNKICKG